MGAEQSPSDADIERLRQACPDLQINPPNIKSFRTLPHPEWDWEFGPR
jgi:hypothetical protein